MRITITIVIHSEPDDTVNPDDPSYYEGVCARCGCTDPAQEGGRYCSNHETPYDYEDDIPF